MAALVKPNFLTHEFTSPLMAHLPFGLLLRFLLDIDFSNRILRAWKLALDSYQESMHGEHLKHALKNLGWGLRQSFAPGENSGVCNEKTLRISPRQSWLHFLANRDVVHPSAER
jgi:ADP-ribosylglycohydrolase